MLLSRFDEDCVELGENFFGAHGVHLTGGVVAFFDDGLEMAAGDLGGEVVGDDFAAAAFLLDPGIAGHGDPHGLAVYLEADVDRVGVAGSYGDDVGFPAAVQVFAGPAVFYVEVFVHGFRVTGAAAWGKGVWAGTIPAAESGALVQLSSFNLSQPH